MPELPEVHTISRDLNKHIKGHVIKNVRIIDTYRTLPTNQEFINEVNGRTITGAERIAKNIIINLNSDKNILIHLAMTGQVLLAEPKDRMPSWTRVILQLANEAAAKTLFFTDMRMFGKIGVISNVEKEQLQHRYGPEPLTESLSSNEFLEQLHSKRTSIKNALLDQNIVSGLGNIYATDALFLAKIHPETPTDKITLEMAENLLTTSRLILKEGIEHRGSTLSDKMYVDIFGKSGTHQNFFRIYGKSECPVCHSKVEFKKINGRGTYFCPICQPAGGQTPLL